MTEEITIRPAQLADAKKLSILYKQVYIKTYGQEGVSDEDANFTTKQFAVTRLEGILSNHPGCIIVAEYKNNLVGVIEIEFDKACPVGKTISPELNKLYILEWFCRMGIGDKLLTAAEEFVRSKGATEMWLCVFFLNSRAISFYEKHQYQFIGTTSFEMETNTYKNNVYLKKLK